MNVLMEEKKNELELFNFNGNEMRKIKGEDGDPWFVAKDVCDILEINNPTEALKKLDSDEKNTIILNEGKRGNPNKSIINESGLYALMMNSRKKQAKEFRRWVTKEVLPAIRKTGNYTSPVVANEVSLYENKQLSDAINTLKEQLPSKEDFSILQKQMKVIERQNLSLDSLRKLLNRNVRRYAKDRGMSHQEVWLAFHKDIHNDVGMYIGEGEDGTKVGFLAEEGLLPKAIEIIEEWECIEETMLVM